MKKAVFFDIDGTLWDNQMQMPNSAVSAVRQLRKNGIYAFICSGRSRAAIQAKELLSGIGFDGILASCGAHIEYQGELIYERLLTAEELEEIFHIADVYHVPIVVEGKNCLYADMEDFSDNVYICNLKKSLGEGFLPLAAEPGRHIANKVTGYFKQGDFEKMKSELTVHYDMIVHTPNVFELVPKGFSKASGIKRICEHLNIPHENTYAFGDGPNDLEMLSYVKYGIAMGNGAKAAKDAADFITKDIWDDGIMEGLKHFSLI